MPELTHEDVIKILECIKNYCDSRRTCFDCPYAHTFKDSQGYTVANCAIYENPYRWRIEVIKENSL